MPAVKKELPGREDLALALATFHPTLAALPLPPLPGYLTPLPAAAALPPAASLPAATAGYEALLAPPLRSPRAYLSLHEAAPHLHLPRDPLALERFSATAAAAPDFQPLLDNGEPCIEVECGANRALLYVRKLCQGSKGPSIRHRGEWLTPNEFQFVSGRETAKDWKRSIRHKGKSLKTLMSKGILQVHPPICDCPGCRISSPVNRGRLADKRTVALPTARVLKKELTPSFSASDGDSDGSGPACGRRPGLKQEDTPHVRIMKRRVHTHWDVNISFRETSCSQDSDLPTLISSVHRSRHLVMPEHQSRCEFQRGGVEIGLGAAGDLLGKRLGRSPHISSDCPLEKKARSKSPQETLLLPEFGPSMAPEDHYRRLVSALSEASTFEDPQRLYHLGLPSHDLLRVRQEVAAAAVRSPSALEVHLPSSTAGQRRKQGLAQHREGTVPAGTPSFSERELSQPPPLLSPQNAPHIALGPHLRPPFLGVPSALCQTPGGDACPAAGAPAEAKPGPAGDVGRAAASEGAGERAPPAAAGARSRPAPVRWRRGVAAARGHAGTMGGLFMDGEEATAPEDLSKWTVDDVCSFVGGLSGCGEYAPVFREQGIDGETLPLLTEEHLLTTMGLKLGPALKIRAQVAKRLGRVFYMASFPVALPLQPPTLRAPERELASGEQSLSPTMAPSPYAGGHPPAGRASPKQENGTVALLPGPADPPQPLC
ncbi:sterile alpha motif domain-containing protein 11 isoform X3 [Canis lupus familiaris]|uniref:sterile alpha motif domain-containing protein 11 isoform X3 n=1 Tax=Canis lupus familiaris TaxID=9615 RepID=UPI0006B3D3B5|nr:sterile alpha motif domain-containing protein 11 isoform X3 [Canis lupus familiaris]XP_038393453.1 sterile alpha motif domain-containing protein 11 isoform X3 [Canis lupus familiaris]|eukprot:XP_013969263.1 sterile alpha motif domain-containing protein 11 isoform X3 [Canis lupus familiaris]